MTQESLTQVQIDGFRGLRNVLLESLSRINILVGANNSGKTSVLEALAILCNPYYPQEWLAMVRRRDFGGLDETRIQSLRWCFRQTGQLQDPKFMFEGRCEMKSLGSFPLRKLTVNYRDITGEPSPKDVERMLRLGRRRAALEIEEEWRGAEITHHVEGDFRQPQSSLFDAGTNSEIEPIVFQFWEEDPTVGRLLRSPPPGNLATETLTPYSYQLNRLQVRSHSYAFLAQSKEGRRDVLDLITQFDPDIVDLGILSLRGRYPAIYLMHRRLGPAPLSVFGDALRRAVLLASTIHMLKGGGVLLIDELETGIHSSGLERVFGWLARAVQQYQVQVIATTHSLEALDAVAVAVKEHIDDFVTYHLDQTTDETRVKRIRGDLFLRLRRERGLDVR
jgi:energy-coupling factor transporter ATP-binding protein EcfA2